MNILKSLNLFFVHHFWARLLIAFGFSSPILVMGFLCASSEGARYGGGGGPCGAAIVLLFPGLFVVLVICIEFFRLLVKDFIPKFYENWGIYVAVILGLVPAAISYIDENWGAAAFFFGVVIPLIFYSLYKTVIKIINKKQKNGI